MNAAYLEPEVKLDPGARTVHADFDIRNESAETWRLPKASAWAITSSTRRPAR